MRLSWEQLKTITQRELPSAQARWFERHFNIKVEYDRQGPIITEAAFNALVMKNLGLAKANAAPIRPQVKLTQSSKAA